MSKDLKQLRSYATTHGWCVEQTRNGHLRWVPPDGGEVVVSGSTPSDHRALANIRARLRRAGLPREDAMNSPTDQADQPQPDPDTDSRLGKLQRRILEVLTYYGGTVESNTGRATAILAEEINAEVRAASQTIKTLADRGLVHRDMDKKRIKAVRLTPKGWKVVADREIVNTEPSKPEPAVETGVQESQNRRLAAHRDEEIVAELTTRLFERQQHIDAQNNSDLKEKLELVASLVKDFEDGKCSALRALSDISEAVAL